MEDVMKGLNIAKIIKDNNYTIVPSSKALQDVTPIEWPKDVLNRNKKVVITDAEAKGKRITIKALFKDYNEDYKPTEVDWGLSRGQEL